MPKRRTHVLKGLGHMVVLPRFIRESYCLPEDKRPLLPETSIVVPLYFIVQWLPWGSLANSVLSEST